MIYWEAAAVGKYIAKKESIIKQYKTENIR
jgi:hypothetical protein